MQIELFGERSAVPVANGRSPAPLLKWIGNKHRVARAIVSQFPHDYGTYFEPFIGSGAVLSALAPPKGLASDSFAPLLEIWKTLKSSPETLKRWYEKRWHAMATGEKRTEYERIKASYNAHPNGADLLFLCRSCYGGVVRFRKVDGYMSTPCGVHDPISPDTFAKRVDLWRERVRGTSFVCAEYREVMDLATSGDLIYCDPPYSYSQAILYGAQAFRIEDLFNAIQDCKRRGVRVAISIDGTKRSGEVACPLPIPNGLFEREIFVNTGRSMLKRFQMNGQSLEGEIVADRLLLTY